MSLHSLLEVECPSCRHLQEILVWQSVNVTRDPELKEQIFTGRINYFTCPSCTFEGFITAPLAYHDMERKFFAWYVPVEYLADREYLTGMFSEDGRVRQESPGGWGEEGGFSYLKDAHIVFSMPELIRYVLFRARLGQVFEGPEQEA